MKKITVDEYMAMQSGPVKRRGTFASKWEEEFSAYLASAMLVRNIREWHYEEVTLILSKGTSGTKAEPGVKGQRYTPDFVVVDKYMQTLVYEVKGYRRPKNINKLKIAAERFPSWQFFLVDKAGDGSWRFKRY